MRITLFGQLKAFAPDGIVDIPAVGNSRELRVSLEQQFPMLARLPYVVAIDKKITTDEVAIQAGQEIAVLPPYSGG